VADAPEQQRTPTATLSGFQVLIVLNIVAAAAVGAAALSVDFLRNRPVDVRAHTTRLAEALDTAILKHVGPDDVALSTPEDRVDSRGVWTHHRIDVALPPHIEPSGLQALVEEAMLDYPVNVTDTADTGSEHRVTFALESFPFAEVVLRAAPAPPRPRVDLRAASKRMADDVWNLLVELNVPLPNIVRMEGVRKENTEHLWIETPMEVTLPANLSPGELRGRIEERFSLRNVQVDVDDGGFGGAALTVMYRDVPTAVIQCRQGKPPAKVAALEGEPDATASLLPPLEAVPLESEEHEGAPPDGPEQAIVPPTARDEVAANPQIAIILDDGGYVLEDVERVLTLDPALTLAIVPNTPYAVETARRGAALGFEIMLHMPMESRSQSVTPVPGQIDTAMTRIEIERLATNALGQIPFVAGANNHTGSAFVLDRERIGMFLDVLKNRGLYFIDSLTAPDSIAYGVAREKGVPAGRRDVFLDNVNDPDAIRAQLDELVTRARRRGSAIGIGHFQRAATSTVLQEAMPRLMAEGVTFVHASELVR